MATRKPRRTRPARRKKTSPSRRARPARATSPARRAFKERRGPETLRLRSITPSFTVDDLQRSLRFYTEALGFIVKERWTSDHGELRGVMLLAGTSELGLSQDDWAKGRNRKKGDGVRVWCETTQDVDALAKRVKAAGFALTEEPKNQSWGQRSFSLDDPDGYHLSIAHEKQ